MTRTLSLAEAWQRLQQAEHQHLCGSCFYAKGLAEKLIDAYENPGIIPLSKLLEIHFYCPQEHVKVGVLEMACFFWRPGRGRVVKVTYS